MYNKIVVPLDGSMRAEKVLAYAANLTRELNATLVLLRVEEAQPLVVNFSESPQIEAGNIIYSENIQPNTSNFGTTGLDPLPAYVTNQYQTVTSYTTQEAAEDYLQKVKENLVGAEAETPLEAKQIQIRVVCDRSSKELAAIIKEEQADLIVMTTHGRSGLSLLLTGSVATRVIQHSSLPVILIKSDETQNVEKGHKQPVNISLDPILVALDGTREAEAVLEQAANLARQLGVKIHLFEVVSNVLPGGEAGGFYYPPDYDQDKETTALRIQAQQHLEETQARLRERGVESIVVVQTGQPIVPLEYNKEPITKIINYAREIKAQLVAMTTHGRGRVGQLVLGSTAEEVVRESQLPVMLMRKLDHSNHPIEN